MTKQCSVAMLSSNARQQWHVRTYATNGLTKSMAEDQGHLTFRNARARIRRFPSADFGDKR